MNQPTPVDPPAAPPSENHSQPAANRWTTLIVVVIAIAIVGIPLLTNALPVEISRWHLAHALVAARDGDLEQVEASLQRAESYAPQDPQVFLTRCEIMRELERFDESLAAADRALELSPESLLAQNARGATLMKMKRFAEAADAFEAILGPSPSSGRLNNVAYARGLAGEKLDLGLEEINQALALRPDGESIDRAALVDTRGYILYKQGKYEAALKDFDQAIGALDPRRIDHLADQLGGQRMGSQREEIIESTRMSLAVMLYHRALAHEALGHAERAEADLAKVRELGYEPGDDLF